jgi:hypothetical protein
MRELAITTWAVAGVGLLFLEGVARLGMRTLRLLREGMDAPSWAVLVVVVALFCWGEGYLALQRRFVPHVIARAVECGRAATGCLPVLGAPLYAMSLVGVRPRELARAWLGVLLIVVAIVVVRGLPSPWRAIVDAGVTAALAWGLVALGLGLARVIASARKEIVGSG